MSKLCLSLVLFLILTAVNPAVAFAATIPSFPSCSNPNSPIRVQYDSGTHGIVGDSKTYTGKDTVYNLSDGNVLQCFCASDGAGIETYWWKTSSLTENEIDSLTGDDWVYIPNGSAWGLDQGGYLAKNTNYSCGGQVTPAAASTSGSVLGLASTGSLVSIYTYLVFGLISLLSGIALKRQINK